MLIEHDPSIAASICHRLERIGSDSLTVTSVRTLDEARVELERQVAGSATVACVLLGLELPDLTGPVALDWLVGTHPTIPVVTFTTADSTTTFDPISFDPIDRGAQDHRRGGQIDAGVVRAAMRGAADRARADLAERELRAERARRDAIVARSGDLVMFFQPDGTITWVSPASRTMFGMEPDELIGMNGLELIHPDDQARAFEEFLSIPEPGDHIRIEFRVFDPDGKVRWIEEIATNLVDEPSIGVVVGNLHDITDRKSALAEVQFQARLLGAVGQAIVAFDSVGVVLYWNAVAQEIYGWSPTEAIGQNVSNLVMAADGWEERGLELVTEVMAGRAWSGEFRVQRRDGTVLPLLVTNTPVLDDDGRHIATIGVSTDISDRLRTEALAAELSSIVESSNDAIFSNDLDGLITTWNRAAGTLYGYDESEVLGRHMSMLGPPGSPPTIAPVLERLRQGHAITRVETLGTRADGSVVNLSVSMSPLLNSAGAMTGASTIARDITERVESDRGVQADRRRLAEAQASARLGSYEINIESGDVTLSDEFWRIIGRDPGDATYADIDVAHPADRQRVLDALDRAMAGEVDVECTHRIVRPTGEVRWVVTRGSRYGESADAVVAGTMLDITERREAELAIEHVAFHDPLTGLANRLMLTGRLDEELLSCADLELGVAVALIDLDQFKIINDTLGHSAGDAMLRAVARRLESALEPCETIARFGGDEFAVIRREVTDLCECAEIGERLTAAMTEPIVVDQREFHMSMSVGIVLSRIGDTADSILRDADTAMYHAKESGRARVALFDESLRVASRRRLDIGTELRTALDRDELSVVFQPVLSLSTLETSGFEALLRWTHPTLGIVRPDEFIPIAEETGLILPIGEWVLARSLSQIAQWRRHATPGHEPWVAVNLSARQVEHPDLIARVGAALEAAQVPASALHLEITESVLMDTIDRAFETVSDLRALGIRISIDDFGTGYSSLSYLKRLPIDTLKVDRSFIDGLGTDTDDTSIVQAIVNLAHTLHLDVVAEGIETPTQLDALVELGCAYGQGFLWSPGVPPELAAEWLSR